MGGAEVGNGQGVDDADSFTLIDLRPIRPLVFVARHEALDAPLVRVIYGFDSLLVLHQLGGRYRDHRQPQSSVRH